MERNSALEREDSRRRTTTYIVVRTLTRLTHLPICHLNPADRPGGDFNSIMPVCAGVRNANAGNIQTEPIKELWLPCDDATQSSPTCVRTPPASNTPYQMDYDSTAISNQRERGRPNATPSNELAQAAHQSTRLTCMHFPRNGRHLPQESFACGSYRQTTYFSAACGAWVG